MKHLTELRLDSFFMTFGDAKRNMLQFKPILSVRVLILEHVNLMQTDLDEHEFLKFIARVFPNIAKLNLYIIDNVDVKCPLVGIVGNVFSHVAICYIACSHRFNHL